ncbi:MAG: argininosuccinate synthase [Rickettsiales bacterium]|nr:argininosuccinate synthase [Rickettsiales bacterium]|tara:strand:+ start:1093 stop:2298 length:1206 start_codon:yes stop_codon:yes gene_type:complete
MKNNVKKIVLAFSGGLDTSIILKWLQENYKCEVVTFTADIGQGVEIEKAKRIAEELDVKEIFIEDLREEFVKNYIFPMFRANSLYEGHYLLGTAIARPLIAKRQVEIATKVNADTVSHGATGKGNDQIRFELGYYANNPEINVIAPWRIWDLNSRQALLEYAKEKNISFSEDKYNEPPYSMDANILHTSYEGKSLEDPWIRYSENMFSRTVSISSAPDQFEEIEITFSKGDPVSINGKKMSGTQIFEKLNQLGGKHGIGRIDIVENRFIGMKSRGVYETPGGTILLEARRAIESLTLDRGAAHLKDEIMPKYAELIYNGFWFSPERQMLQSLIDKSQEYVNGSVVVRLYKGNVQVLQRKSSDSIYSSKIATFENDDVYNQADAEGFISLNSLRLKLLKKRI